MNFNDPDIVNKIIENAGHILRQAKSTVINHPKFKILSSNYLEKYWMNRVNKKNLFTIYIKESCLDKLDFKKIKSNLDTVIQNTLHTSNFLEVNENFEVLLSENHFFKDTQEAKGYLKSKSEEGYCVFFFGPVGVDAFVKGESVTDLNFFYSNEDVERFYEKGDISSIKDVLRSYQNHCLRKQFEYSRFFVDKGTIDKLGFGNNTLVNKPEKFMRDHLRNFLAERIRHTFRIEMELEATKRELDIYTEAEGESYFFEIKWLGKSINQERDKISVNYADARAREGVKQTLEYIEELVEVMGANVRAGYLVIFDAREEKKEIDFQGFSNVDDNLKEYMELFDIMPPLNLSNVHPS
ncbi:hypothetical protein ACZ11_01305 [Lysinibacillus xylanilyticus]|uniref:Uncharacterized protein n=1 Tax=Lysinibacillus xylanilyticus TaxID=582475 RepID=A0A0K9FHX3_9BACI|nr:hypothetical protein [Lysinibacillus xylanilyticus]KMY33746.1 hypothetical protein ACZ11_01305 [Lysinibacillus xylanilyticus]